MPEETTKTTMEKLLAGEVKLELEVAGEIRQEEEWLIVPWRALSEGILEDRPLNFSAPVLKAGLLEFNGAPVFPDHWDSVRNWLGRTNNASWEKTGARKMADGSPMPAGVNFEVWLDRTVTPEEAPDSFRIIKGVEKGVLRCGSVDVRFEYQPSHPNLENWRYRLGEMVDGRMVCLEVTKIRRIAEFSIVYAGSDKYAARLALDQPLEKEEAVSEQIMVQVKAALGLNADATEKAMVEAIDKLKSNASIKLKVGEGDEAREITGKEAILKAALDGYTWREKLVERAQAAYKLVRGDQANQGYLDSIPSMDTAAVLAIAEEYEAQQEKLMPLKCAACGSTVTRRSSEGGTVEEGSGGGFDVVNV